MPLPELRLVRVGVLVIMGVCVGFHAGLRVPLRPGAPATASARRRSPRTPRLDRILIFIMST
ncbi:MAG: hypothetical protein ACM37U_08420, partial [Gemmatimonas sp.]